MTVATTADPRSPAQPNGSPKLFGYSVTKDGRTIMELFGLNGEGAQVRVEAAVSPVYDRDDGEPVRWSHVFPTAEQAMRFADETVIAFEYLNCAVTELSVKRS